MNDPKKLFIFVWRVLSEVPGWPDAPLRLRWLRALPITVPCALLAGMAVWTWLIQGPVESSARQTYAPYIELEQELEALRLAYSDQHAADLVQKAAQAELTLFHSDAELRDVLDRFEAAAAQAWSVRLAISDPLDAADPDACYRTQNVRLTLIPKAENTKPLPSLLALLERLSSPEKRIELSRLGIRADDQGWRSVDVTLLAARPLPHAKTP